MASIPIALEIPGVNTPLTRYVLGTMSFGDTADAATGEKMLETALAVGITGADTANGYAQSRTESILAPLIKPHRENIVLATKAGMPHPDSDGLAPLSRQALRRCVEGSLRRLDTEWIDVFYLHQPDRSTPIAETIAEVKALHEEGKIRSLGVSNYAAWQVGDIIHAAEQQETLKPIIGQNVYSLVSRRVEDEWLEFSAHHQILTMCYNPLAGGLLVAPPVEGTAPSRFSTSVLASMYRDRYWTPNVLSAVENLSKIAQESGMSLIELSLRWLNSRPGVGAILLGGDDPKHLLGNLDFLLNGPLPKDVLEECTKATEDLKGNMAAYNR